jgi:hypothetical protein
MCGGWRANSRARAWRTVPTLAFVSRAVMAGSTGAHRQVFMRDRFDGRLTLVSADANGVEGNADSGRPAISADALTIAFDTTASNLVGHDSNAVRDVIVWSANRSIGPTRAIVGAGGAQHNSPSSEAAHSGMTELNGLSGQWGSALRRLDELEQAIGSNPSGFALTLPVARAHQLLAMGQRDLALQTLERIAHQLPSGRDDVSRGVGGLPVRCVNAAWQRDAAQVDECAGQGPDSVALAPGVGAAPRSWSLAGARGVGASLERRLADDVPARICGRPLRGADRRRLCIGQGGRPTRT